MNAPIVKQSEDIASRIKEHLGPIRDLNDKISAIQSNLEDAGIDSDFRFYAKQSFTVSDDPTQYNLGWGDTDDGDTGFVVRYHGTPPDGDDRLPKRNVRLLLTECRTPVKLVAVSHLEALLKQMEEEVVSQAQGIDDAIGNIQKRFVKSQD